MCHAHVISFGLRFEFRVDLILETVVLNFFQKWNHSLVLFCFCLVLG